MFKTCLTLLLALPGALYAQSTGSQHLITAPVAGSAGAGQTMATPMKHPLAAGSLTASFAYVYTDSQNGPNRSLMGWAVVPELRVYKNIHMQGDFESLYMKSVYPGQSRFLIAAGPRYDFAPRSKFTPFVFGEGGEMRLTSKGVSYSDWNPVAKGGVGVNYKLTRDFSFQLIPGEYLGQYQDDGSWNHSFSARAGFTLNFMPRQ